MNLLRILTYHRIAPLSIESRLDPHLISAIPEHFEKQMKHLAKNYYTVSLDEVLNALETKKSLQRNAIMITFDDAYSDFKEFALPVLKKYNLTATIFVPTAFPDQPHLSFWWDKLYHAMIFTDSTRLNISPFGSFSLATPERSYNNFRKLRRYAKSLLYSDMLKLINEVSDKLNSRSINQNPVLGWEELRKLTKEGISLGAHTRTHPILTDIPLDQVRKEIRDSLNDLRREIGDIHPVFAYPNGNGSEKIAKILAEEGVVAAFASLRGFNDLDNIDPLKIRRINIARSTSLPLFKLRLHQSFSYIDKWQHRLRTRKSLSF